MYPFNGLAVLTSFLHLFATVSSVLSTSTPQPAPSLPDIETSNLAPPNGPLIPFIQSRISSVRETYLGADIVNLDINPNAGYTGWKFKITLLWESPQGEWFHLGTYRLPNSRRWTTPEETPMSSEAAKELASEIFDWGHVKVELYDARDAARGPGKTRGGFSQVMVYKPVVKSPKAISNIMYLVRSNRGYDILVGAEEKEVLPDEKL